MPTDNPFELPGPFFRGNTHTHTTNSDGVHTPEQRCRAYRERGYDFLVITDHRTVTPVDGLSTEDFLVIPGIELHPLNPHGGEIYHIVGIGVDQMIDTTVMSVNATVRAIHEQGGLAVLAHPYWCGHTLTDLGEITGHIGMEIFNTTCCVTIAKGPSEVHWDDWLNRIGPTFGLAVDDCHDATSDAFGGWIMVRAEELTRPAILDALRRGAFYATQGPEIRDIKVTRTPGRLSLDVQTSPARRIAFIQQTFRGAVVDAPEGELIEQASCDTEPGSAYVRIEVTDADGKKAWSNPFFVADDEA